MILFDIRGMEHLCPLFYSLDIIFREWSICSLFYSLDMIVGVWSILVRWFVGLKQHQYHIITILTSVVCTGVYNLNIMLYIEQRNIL